MPDVAIIVPTRNEGENIKPLLERLSTVLADTRYETEIIFVDDGSTDSTREEIRNYSGLLAVHLICRDEESGLATAVRTGARAAQSEILIVMDADLSHPPEAIPDLLQPLLDGSHEMVIGSRYIPGGSTPGWPLARRIASRLATLPARMFTAVHDPLAGFFAVRREVLLSFSGPVAGFKIGLEILAAASDRLRVTEVPITFTERKKGLSKMSTRVMLDYCRQIAILGGLPLDSVNTKDVAMLAGIVISLDILLFHLLQAMGFHLDSVHTISFFMACNLGYLVVASTAKTPFPYFRFSVLLRYQVVLLLFYFLRGGMISTTAERLGESTTLLSLIVAHFSLFASVAGYLFVSRNKNGTARPLNWHLTALFIIFYTVLLRVLYLGSYELIQEEAYYWNYSQHLAMGYLDHPPMVALLIWAGTHLFGDTEVGVRFGSFPCWCVTAWFIYNHTLSVLGKKAALDALVLAATLPLFFGIALFITPDAPLLACWAGAVFFLHRAFIDEHHPSWFGVGVCLGIGLASKYSIALLGPAVFLFMLIDARSRRWFFKPEPYLAAIIALLVFSPVIYWNYQHDWASFLFQSQRRINGAFRFSTPDLLGAVLLLMTPTGILAAWASIRTLGQQEQTIPQTVSDTGRRYHVFVSCMVLVPLAVFMIISLSKEIKLSWAGPLWLAAIPLIASTLHADAQSGRVHSLVQRLWPATLATLVLSYGFILHYVSLGLPGIPFSSRTFLFGADDLARQVLDTAEKFAAEEGNIPLVVGMDTYRITSGLAFYLHKQADSAVDPRHHGTAPETAGRHIFGKNALMYKYWLSPELAAGRDILIVAESKKYLADQQFSNYAGTFGNIGSYEVNKVGKKVGSYYYRHIHSYLPKGVAISNGQSRSPLALKLQMPDEKSSMTMWSL